MPSLRDVRIIDEREGCRMPVPDPDWDFHNQAEVYQLLLQMDRKLDKLAAALQKTNSVLQKWPAMINQGTLSTASTEKPKDVAAKEAAATSQPAHVSEEPTMITTPQGVTIVRF